MRAGSILLYGAGQLGMMLLTRYFFQWVIRFADVGKDTSTGPLFAAATVGALFFVFRIFDGVADPIAGAFGDRWVGKGRQRRSLIWISFAIPAIGLALVFAPSADMAPGLRWALLISGMSFFFVGYSLYAIPYWSLVEDYSLGNNKTRTSLSNTLGVGVLAATGIGFIASPVLIEKVGFLSGALIFGAVGTVLMILPYFAAPKGNVPPARAMAVPPFLESLRASLTHRRFLAVVILFAGAHMSMTVMTSAAPYIAERLLHGTIGDVAKLLGPFLATAVPTFFVVPTFARRFGWEKATLVGAITLSLAYMGAGLLGQGIIGSPMTTAMLVFACAGPGAAFVLGLEGEAITRCAEQSKYESTGVYFGICNLVVQTLNGLALFLTGMLAERGSMAAVRAMPMSAGLMCVLGVVVYWLVKRSESAPSPRADD